MAQTAAIKVPIVGVDLYSKQFKKLSATVQKVGRNMTAMGGAMTRSLTLPIAGFAVLAGKSAIQFDDSMRKVEAKAKATGVSMNMLRQRAKDLGRDTKFRASEAADGMDKLAMAGWNTTEIFDGIGGVLSLAAASSSDLAQSADVTSNIMGAFNINAKESNRVADVIAATLTGANVDMTEYADAMKYSSTIAKEYGMSIEDTSAAIGFLGNVGIKGSQAGTSMKKMMLNITTGAMGAGEAFKKLGVETADEQGNMRRMTDVIGDLNKAFTEGAFTKQQKLTMFKDIFGERAIVGAAAITRDLTNASGSFNELITDLNTLQPGKAQAMAELMEGGAGGAWRRTLSAFEGLQIAFAESGLMDIAAKAMESLAESMRQLAKSDPEVLKKIAKGALALAAAGPGLMILGKIVTGVGSLMSAAPMLGTLATAIGPQAPVVLGVAALAAAIFYFRDELKPTIDMVKNELLVVFAEMKSIFVGNETAAGNLSFSFGEVGAALKTIVSFLEPSIRFFTRLSVKIGLLPLRWFISNLKNVAKIASYWVKIWRKIGWSLKFAKTWMSGVIKKLISSIPWLKKVAEYVKSIGKHFERAFNKMGRFKDKVSKDILGASGSIDQFIGHKRGMFNKFLMTNPNDESGVKELKTNSKQEIKVKLEAEKGTKFKSVKSTPGVDVSSEYFGDTMAGDFI